MLTFLIGIICILLHRPKKPTLGQNSRPNSNSGVHPGLKQTNMGSDDQKNLQQNQFKDIQDETFLKAAETGALRYRFSTQQDYQTLNPQICPI